MNFLELLIKNHMSGRKVFSHSTIESFLIKKMIRKNGFC
jgi:hypothetical protein